MSRDKAREDALNAHETASRAYETASASASASAPASDSASTMAAASDAPTATNPSAGAAAPAVLEATSLACGYDGRAVVSGISFELRPGDVLSLLGPNGVGKTTLFKTLLGLQDPIEGSVRIEGRDLGDWGERELAREVGYIAQSHNPAFSYTVEQVVLMGRTPYVSGLSGPGERDEQIAHDSMERMGISHLAQRDYTQLSGGEQQMVMIARALAQRPRILVMDEPCASLDLGNQALLLSQVARLASEGMAVVMTTHDPNHAFALDGQVLCLHGGGLAAMGRATEVLTADVMRKMYGVPVAVGRIGMDVSASGEGGCDGEGDSGGESVVACVPLVSQVLREATEKR